MFVKLESVASRLVNSKWMKKQQTEKLSNDKERTGKHFVRTYMYFHLVLVLSWVLQCCFLEQNMLDSELGNLKLYRAWQTAKFITSWTRLDIWNHVSLELHCKGKTFAAKSRYIWFMLLFCPASTSKLNCVIIWSNVSCNFLRRSCFVPGVCEPNNFKLKRIFTKEVRYSFAYCHYLHC